EHKRQRRNNRDNDAVADGEDGASNTPKPSNMSIPFSAEEIAAEDRRPKRKVAVLIGYAGTGYKGMQINHDEKTIEGDLFAAFVAAGAIQKRNADDPKKSSFIRCARTDKGVHAAGNVISLKLTIEDADIVDKINAHLPEQIRVWGYQRTNNAFNCYQACDSRWYEYLLPSYTLLPPHPQTFLGKKVIEAAKEKGVWQECLQAWEDVQGYWDDVEKNDIKPILDELDDKSREEVLQKIHASEDAQENMQEDETAQKKRKADEVEERDAKKVKTGEDNSADKEVDAADVTPETTQVESEGEPQVAPEPTAAEIALKKIKAAYVAAKRRYRVTPARVEQLQAALNQYLGTNNFHNYTVHKTFKDPSAKRLIRSFVVNPKPIQIRDTEWLSLKVHGQSFMMHQIRKMVAMAVLSVRCAAPLERIKESYGPTRISIPKAPGLGLLLERPVFETYSKKAQENFGKEALNFDKYEKEIEDFKHKQIYTRIWDTEEKDASFHVFLHQLDSFNTNYFLWVTAHGFDAAYEPKERFDPKQKSTLKDLEQELVGDDED
ncbi:pseudouridine synthase, partial [Cryphonectria parasitica EP155]